MSCVGVRARESCAGGGATSHELAGDLRSAVDAVRKDMSALRKHCDENLSANERAIDGLRRQHRDQLEAYDIQISELRNQLSEKLDRQHLAYDVEFKDLHGKFDANATAVMNLAQRCEDQQRADDAAAAEFPNLASRLPSLTVDDTTHLLAEQADGLRYCMLKLEEQMIEQQKVSQIMTNHDDQLLELRQLQQKMETRATMGPPQQSADCCMSGGVLFSDNDSPRLENSVMQNVDPSVHGSLVEGYNATQSEHHGVNNMEATENQEEVLLETTQQLADQAPHEMSTSLWECVALIGVQCVGVMGSIVIVCALFLNVALQGLFTYIIYLDFLTPHDIPDVASMEQWRRTDGHSYANSDKVSGASLVRRVCDGDESLSIAGAQMYSLISIRRFNHEYGLGPFQFTIGPVLCALASVLWFFCVQAEMQECISFANAVTTIPVGRTRLAHSGDKFALVSMSMYHRVFLLLLTFMRLVIAIVLLIVGVGWLGNTTSIQDVVLNAMALCFVMDLDEMLFETVVPSPTRLIVSDLEPLPRRSFPHWRGTSCSPFITLVLCSAVVSIVMLQFVYPNLETMLEVEGKMCDNNVDFVLDRHEQLGFVAGFTTEVPGEAGQDLNTMEAAIREIISGPQPPVVMGRNYTNVAYTERSFFRSSMSWSVADWTKNVGSPTCDDIDFSDLPLWIVGVLRQQTGIKDLSSCKDLAGNITKCTSFWTPMVRTYCPETCGCNAVYPSLFLSGPSGGCPREKCRMRRDYTNGQALATCSDLPVTVLSDPTQKEGRAWQAFFDQYLQVEVNESKVTTASYYSEFIDTLKTWGCEGLKTREYSQMFCHDTARYSSLAPFCPLACGCHRVHRPDCPSACGFYSAVYQQAVYAVPCKDLSPGELHSSLVWNQFWLAYVKISDLLLSNFDVDVNELGYILLRGCSEVFQSIPEEFIPVLIPFCPIKASVCPGDYRNDYRCPPQCWKY